MDEKGTDNADDKMEGIYRRGGYTAGVDVYKTRYFIRHSTSAISILGELEIVKKHGYGHITVNKTNDYVIKLEPRAPHFHTWL